jgi:twinkle protein
VQIEDDGASAVWLCHRATCEWTGGSSVADGGGGGGGKSGGAAAKKGRREGGNRGSGTAVGTGMRRGAGAGGAVKLPPAEALERIGPGTLTRAAAQWGEWLARRGISLETAERNGLASQRVYSPIKSGHVDALVFPYMRDGELVNIKYRGEDKSFWQVKGAEKIMFGLDDIAGQREIIIVEGEMDKLALEEAGVKNVVSVPDGAPGKVKDGPIPAPEEDRKFEYLWNCRAALDPISRIVIAADADPPGIALGEELARRLGKDRCYRVTWPEGCKDANDVLRNEGAAALRGCIDNAEGFPLRGLFRFSDFEDDISNYFGGAVQVEFN